MLCTNVKSAAWKENRKITMDEMKSFELDGQQMLAVMRSVDLHEPYQHVASDSEATSWYCNGCGVTVGVEGCYTWSTVRPIINASYETSVGFEITKE
jgi:hypothetical protein